MKTLILLGFITAALGQDGSGFLYNVAPDAPVKLDVYMDLLCEESKAMFHQLSVLVDSFPDNQVQMKIHMFPLPYNTYSFFAAQGAYIFSKMIEERDDLTGMNGTANINGTAITVFDWFNRVIDEMDSFKRPSVDEDTLKSVLERYANLVDNFGLDTRKFYNRLSAEQEDYNDAVHAWKYGADRGVHSTPLVFINGEIVQAPSDYETIKQEIANILTV